MSKSVIQYSLLISCPGDIKEEINCVEECVTQFNTLYSDALGIEIVTKHWRKSSYAQSGGKPQALLNEQFVNDCDAAVAILKSHDFSVKLGENVYEVYGYLAGTDQQRADDINNMFRDDEVKAILCLFELYHLVLMMVAQIVKCLVYVHCFILFHLQI